MPASSIDRAGRIFRSVCSPTKKAASIAPSWPQKRMACIAWS
jgi:hypothetical protein